MSFLTHSHKFQESSKYDVSFQFRTTLPSGLLLTINEQDISLLAYLEDGSIHVATETDGLVNTIKETSQNLNDGNWRDVAIRISGHQIFLNISNWLREDMLHSSTFQIYSTTFGFGRIAPLIELIVGPVPGFVGCMRDIRVSGQLVIPQTLPQKRNIRFECDRTEQCFPDTCLNGGLCKDLWYTYKCECFRPFFGASCESNVPPATYGFGNTASWSVLPILPDDATSLSKLVKVSTFLRTRQSEGLLFYLGPSLQKGMSDSGQYGHNSPAGISIPTLKTSEDNQGFLAAFLSGGFLKVLSGGNDYSTELTSHGQELNNGNYHFIEVERNTSHLTLWVNRSISDQQEVQGQQNYEVLYIGGVPSTLSGHTNPDSRQKRQALSTFINMHFLDNVTYFRGIVQDFRLNNRLVPVFPLRLNESNYSVHSDTLVPKVYNVPIESVNVSSGVLSNDPCLVSNPCENGGKCVDNWDAYRCECVPGFRGINCSEREPCSLYTCPGGATCQNLPIGYECVSEASFRGNQSLLYQSNLGSGKLSQHSLSLHFRTQYMGGTLMEVVGQGNSSGHKLWIKAEDSVVVQWTLWPEDVIASLNVGSGVTDGQWHFVEVHVNQTTVKAELVTGQQTIKRYTEYNSSTASLMQLLEKGKCLLGGPDDLDSSNSKFKGCMREVRVGGLLLPFFGAQLLTNNESPDQFVLDPSFGQLPVPQGCLLCWPEDCSNGGTCMEPNNSSLCSCPEQFQGSTCDVDVDECLSTQCMNNGSCLNLFGGFNCKCTEDYTGQLCETEIDPCESQPCSNGGTCLHKGSLYTCECPPAFKGDQCQELNHIGCSSQPCQNNGTCEETRGQFVCHCKDGSYGPLCQHLRDFCVDVSCSNNGLCQNLPLQPEQYRCLCHRGYTGVSCAQEVDPCDSSPCLNDGECFSEGNRKFTCRCKLGWTGSNCEEDINECKEKDDLCQNGGVCNNTEGGYECFCSEGWTGRNCSLVDPCHANHTCQNGGTCIFSVNELEQSTAVRCRCTEDFEGELCERARDSEIDLALVIGLTLGCICFICILVAVVVFLRIAKKKRATRGTYSPSRQEMFGSRVEMNHVMKPPPEERLI